MKVRQFGWAMALVLALGGCKFQSDFSGLSFAPDTRSSDSSPEVTPQDTITNELVGIDTHVPDQRQPQDTATGEMPDCVDFMNCVLFEKRCQDVSDQSCPNSCADSDQWRDYALFNDLYSAMGNCQLGGTSDAEFLPCLYSDNALTVTACLGEEGGQDNCAQVMSCMLESQPSCNARIAPKAYLGCLGKCALGVSAIGQKGLSMLLSTCSSLVPGAGGGVVSQETLGECSEALQECYGASGSRTCPSLVSCMAPTCLKCAATGSGTACDAATCVAKCLNGASSEKAVELALGSVAAGFSAASNVFTSAVIFTTCIQPSSGVRTCGQVYAEIETLVKSGDPHLPVNYDNLLDLIAQVTDDDVGRLRNALECLEEKLAETAFVFDALDWPTCKLKCN